MGGCQNHGPFLDPYSSAAPHVQGTQKGTIILTTTHILYVYMILFGIVFGFLSASIGGRALHTNVRFRV